jgi:hypothetical protein
VFLRKGRGADGQEEIVTVAFLRRHLEGLARTFAFLRLARQPDAPAKPRRDDDFSAAAVAWAVGADLGSRLPVGSVWGKCDYD